MLRSCEKQVYKIFLTEEHDKVTFSSRRKMFVCKQNEWQKDSCKPNYVATATKNTANVSEMGADENIRM
jgi:hypothetical protein